MKLWEFERLCKTEWDNGQGDVRALWLLEDSLKELQADIVMYSPQGRREDASPALRRPPEASRGRLPDVRGQPDDPQRPEAPGEVTLHICRDYDMADVFFPDGKFEAHVLSRS